MLVSSILCVAMAAEDCYAMVMSHPGAPLKLAVQEQLVPGDTLLEKWDVAVRCGYHALEMRPTGNFAFENRLPELVEAADYGVVMRTACVDMPTTFIGAFDPNASNDAVENLTSQLTTMVRIGGKGAGVVTPAAYGMFSFCLPPFEDPPRNGAGDKKVLHGALSRVAEHAEKVGAEVHLEPLNRYGDHMVNTLGQAVELVQAVGSKALKVVLDTFHANIEEDNTAAAILAAGEHIGHVQLGDNQRYQPGTGQLQWQPVLQALRRINYNRIMALECRLRGEPEAALHNAAAFMQEQWVEAVGVVEAERAAQAAPTAKTR